MPRNAFFPEFHMARTLEFLFAGQSFSCAIDKVDRSKLYGSVDVETRDTAGLKCQLATLANDGRTLIQSGGIAFGYLGPDGMWLQRSQLTAVDARGARLNTVASSFNSPIELEFRTTPERLLDHSIHAAYALDAAEGLPAKVQQELDGGAIFKIDFSYRGGTGVDPAFVMRGGDGTLWLLVGAENNIDFIGFQQTAGLAGNEGADDAEAGDGLDFEML
jgi:hypothetical protein